MQGADGVLLAVWQWPSVLVSRGGAITPRLLRDLDFIGAVGVSILFLFFSIQKRMQSQWLVSGSQHALSFPAVVLRGLTCGMDQSGGLHLLFEPESELRVSVGMSLICAVSQGHGSKATTKN